MFSFDSLQHIFVLRLLKNYHFPSTTLLHNLIFLASAAEIEPQELGFYDFLRTRAGAFSPYLQEIIDDLRENGLITKNGHQVTDKGRLYSDYFGISLAPFFSFFELCASLFNHCSGNPEILKKVVFSHLSFRRVRVAEEIFRGQWV